MLDLSFVHSPIFEADSNFLGFIYFALEEATNELLLANLENATALGATILPLAIVVELSLVLTKPMPESLAELAHVDVLASDKLSMPLVEVIAEVADVFMD